MQWNNDAFFLGTSCSAGIAVKGKCGVDFFKLRNRSDRNLKSWAYSFTCSQHVCAGGLDLRIQCIQVVQLQGHVFCSIWVLWIVLRSRQFVKKIDEQREPKHTKIPVIVFRYVACSYFYLNSHEKNIIQVNYRAYYYNSSLASSDISLHCDCGFI